MTRISIRILARVLRETKQGEERDLKKPQVDILTKPAQMGSKRASGSKTPGGWIVHQHAWAPKPKVQKKIEKNS